MYCVKCGMQHPETSSFCLNCGSRLNNCNIINANNNIQYDNNINFYSHAYPLIEKFDYESKKVLTFGIISIIINFFFAIIGFILSIITLCISGSEKIPELNLHSTLEIAEFESAYRRYRLGRTLASITIIIDSIIIAIIVLLILFSSTLYLMLQGIF